MSLELLVPSRELPTVRILLPVCLLLFRDSRLLTPDSRLPRYWIQDVTALRVRAARAPSAILGAVNLTRRQVVPHNLSQCIKKSGAIVQRWCADELGNTGPVRYLTVFAVELG